MRQPDGTCSCGGRLVVLTAVDEPDEPNDVMGAVVCSKCERLTKFLKPGPGDLERGRELAERFGW